MFSGPTNSTKSSVLATVVFGTFSGLVQSYLQHERTQHIIEHLVSALTTVSCIKLLDVATTIIESALRSGFSQCVTPLPHLVNRRGS